MPFPAKMKAQKGGSKEMEESPSMEKGEAPEVGEAKHKKPCMACKRKGKKGACNCKHKMDTALTPQEYLDACDLGIHNRSRAFIRASLEVRNDKKCGRSGIAKHKQCRQGVVGTSKSVMGNEKVKTGLKVAAVAGGVAAGVAGGMRYRGLQANARSNLRVVRGMRSATRAANPRPTNSAAGIPDPWTNQVTNKQASAARSLNNQQASSMLRQGGVPLSKARARKASQQGAAKAQAGFKTAKRQLRRTQLGFIRQKRNLSSGR